MITERQAVRYSQRVENVRGKFSFSGIARSGIVALLVGMVAFSSAFAGSEPDSEAIEPITLAILQSEPEDAKVLRECTTCHLFTLSEIKTQGRLARKKHKRVLSGKKVCVDCHESGEMCCHERVFSAATLVPYEASLRNQLAAKGL